ncbi:cytochrome C oxidase subunit II [Piscibacillus halophilus]|uniref:cytochrome C oxidase subunit II n=1 Tax=Piscibacillus halophilus TaxID=571933 RepID=UPI0024095099|nr:cytochrome C oxidase subunit II [Piscibacillus halophilus]
MKKWFLSFSLIVMVTLAACGGEDSNGDQDAQEVTDKIILEATNFDFDQETYEVESGDITIELLNKEGMHGITIDELEDFELQGDERKTVHLDPGEYTVRCSVPCGEGHMDMVATIVAN